MSGVLDYVAHVALPNKNPLMMWGAVFDLVVNRNRGTSVHKQWVQSLENVNITGIYFHTLHLWNDFDKCPAGGSHAGWFQVHNEVLGGLINQRDVLIDPKRSVWSHFFSMFELPVLCHTTDFVPLTRGQISSAASRFSI